MSLFRASRPREVSVHISVHKDGYRSASITGGTVEEVAALMSDLLGHPGVTAAAAVNAEPDIN